MTLKPILALGAAYLFASTAVSAASVSFDVRSFADDGDVVNNGQLSALDQNKQDDVVVGVSTSISTAASEDLQNASASFSANVRTGELKFGASARSGKSELDNSNSQNRATGTAELTFTETFTSIGSGDVTFMAAIDGTLVDLDGFGNGNARIDATLRGFAPFGGNDDSSFFRTTGLLGGGTFAVDELLSITFRVPENQTVTLNLDLFAQADAQTSLGTRQAGSEANFFNTATLSFTTTNGLQLFASDPNFLAGPSTDPMSPVPVPASLPLMMAGMGGLMVLRNRKKRA